MPDTGYQVFAKGQYGNLGAVLAETATTSVDQFGSVEPRAKGKSGGWYMLRYGVTEANMVMEIP